MRDAALSLVWGTHSSCQAIVEKEVFQESLVRNEDPFRHASIPSDFVNDLPSDLVEEFRNVSDASTKVLIPEFRFFDEDESFVPGIDGSHLRNSCKHGRELPCIDPVAEVA